MSESGKILFSRRRAAGDCVQCGKPANGKANCPECAEKNNECRRNRVAKRKTLGVCSDCKGVVKPGCTMCESCISKRSEVKMQHYYANKAAGVCRICGEASGGNCYCPKHAEENKAKCNQAYKQCCANGICFHCGKVAAEGKKLCITCGLIANEKAKNSHQVRRKKVFDHYGWICRCCGEDIPEFMEMDHVKGGGTKHLKEIGKSAFYGWLIRNKFPEGFQTLCSNCNRAKHNHGICPHQRGRNVESESKSISCGVGGSPDS